RPQKAGVQVADIQAGLAGVIAILAALHERQRTGRGQLVETSLLGAMVASLTFQATRWLIGGELPERTGNAHPSIAPYGLFECRDGHLQIAVGNERIWSRLCRELGMDSAARRYRDNGARVRNREALTAEINERLAARDLAHWISVLNDA